MIRSPLFIVFEGIDGCGKSTQADLLFHYIKSQNLPLEKLFEPTYGKWGREIRKMLKSDVMPPASEQLKLFLLDREDDVEKNILPSLKKSKIVIMDRYYYSNAAYQGAAGIAPSEIIAENIKRNFPLPDRVYLIDIEPRLALQRISMRDNKDREIFERESFLKKVREIYISIADKRFLIIDGELETREIFQIIKNDMEKNFG